MTSWGEVKSAMTVYSKTSLSCLRSIPFCRSSSGAGKSDLDVMDVHVTRQNLSLLLPKKHCTNIQRKNGKQEKSKAIFNLQETPESSDDIPSKIENVSKKTTSTVSYTFLTYLFFFNQHQHHTDSWNPTKLCSSRIIFYFPKRWAPARLAKD